MITPKRKDELNSFRVEELTHNEHKYYILQRFRWFWWYTIRERDCGTTSDKSFKSIEDAKCYAESIVKPKPEKKIIYL